MLPINLTISGIYSYKEKQEIDFLKLTEDKLFGIFGKVGSGKSTILEAMSLALYGQTERLNLQDKRSYNIMNLDSNKLWIDFEFLGGLGDKKLYRYTYEAKRNSKKFDDIRTPERKAYVKREGDWHLLEELNTNEATGMSYENFKHSIIIPQGKFQSFISQSPMQRTNMLEELFQLNRFDFSGTVAKLKKKCEQEKSFLEGELSHLQEISKETLAEKERNLSEIDKNRQNKSREYQNKKKEFEKSKELYDKNQVLQNHQAELKDLLNSEEKIKLYKEKVKSYEYVEGKFSKLYFEYEHLNKEVKKTETSIIPKRAELETLSKKLKEDAKEFEKTEQNFLQKEIFEKKIAELECIVDLKELDKEEVKNQTSLNELKEEKKRIALDKQKAKEKIENLELQINKSHENQRVLVEIVKVDSWNSTTNMLIDSIEKTKNSLARIEKEVEETKSYFFDEAINLKIEIGEASEKNLEKLKSIVISSLKKEATELEQCNQKAENLSFEVMLSQKAYLLHPDEKCPLCGSKEHPSPANNATAMHLYKENSQKKISIEKSIDAIKNLLTRLEERIRQQANDLIQIDVLRKELKKLQEKLEKHNAAFPSTKTEWKNSNYLEAAKIEIQDGEKEHKKLQRDLGEQKTFLETLFEKGEANTNALLEIEKQTAALKGKKEQALSQLHFFDFEIEKNKALDDLEEKIKGGKKFIAEIEVKYENQKQKINKKQNILNQLKGSINQEEESLKGLNMQLDKIVKQLNKEIKDTATVKDIEDIKQIFLYKDQLEQYRKAVKEFDERKFNIEESIKKLNAEIDGQRVSQEDVQKLKQSLIDLEELLYQLSNESEVLKREITATQTNLEKKKKLSVEKEQKDKRIDQLQLLQKLFKGKGFVSYVSSIYLHQLIQTANERFKKLTNYQLQLEVGENNELMIIDYLNSGRRRLVKTLSGGQTFQASLCLALALSDHVQSMKQSDQSFFFLDEGFGSLDKESLSIVFESLRNLRKENRIVGVISHVEELQQEVDVYLKITHSEEKGSKINSSW